MNKNSVLLVYLIHNVIIPGLHGTHVQFFGEENYSDLLFESNKTGYCVDPEIWEFVKSIKTDTCLRLYSDRNCKSVIKWIHNPNEKLIRPTFIASFQSCYPNEEESPLNFDIISYTGGTVGVPTLLERYTGVCSCQNLPDYIQEMETWSIDNQTNDLLVFYERGCNERKLKSRKIKAGESYTYVQPEINEFTYFGQPVHIVKSFAPIPGSIRKCVIMERELFELSNNTERQNSDLGDPMRSTARQRPPTTQFFRNYKLKDFLFESNSTAKCTNLPKPNDPRFVTDIILSIKTDSCIMVYSSYDCTGRSFKLGPRGSHNLTENWLSTVTGPKTTASIYKLTPNWKWYTKSFNICTEGEARLNVDITQYQGEDEQSNLNVFERFRDICTCQNIPNYIVERQDKWSINAFGNSLVAYFEDNCETDVSNSLWIPTGRSSFTIGLGLFKQRQQRRKVLRKIRSIGPDPDASYFKKHCIKMFSTIIKFEIDEPTGSNNIERNVSMLASKTVFRNDSPSQLSQTYIASKTVRESVQFDIGKIFSKMNSVHVDKSVDIETRRHKGSSESISTGSNTGWSESESSSLSRSIGAEQRRTKSKSAHKGTDTRDSLSTGLSSQTTVGAEAGVEAFGMSAKASLSTSVGLSGGEEHSNSNTRGKSKGKEVSRSISGSITRGQEISSGLSGGSSEGRENSANYFQEDGFKQSLRTAYGNSGTLSSSGSKSSTIENTKSFQVTQTISVPPCTEQVVHASVKVVTNKLVEYRAISKITGQLGDRQMTSTEVLRFMDRGFEYIGDFDESTVMAYAAGNFTAEYGVSSVINSHGSIIERCHQRLNGCPVCQTCTNECVQQPVPACAKIEE